MAGAAELKKQSTRELISAQNAQHKYINKDLSHEPVVPLTWHATTYKLRKLRKRHRMYLRAFECTHVFACKYKVQKLH